MKFRFFGLLLLTGCASSYVQNAGESNFTDSPVNVQENTVEVKDQSSPHIEFGIRERRILDQPTE